MSKITARVRVHRNKRMAVAARACVLMEKMQRLQQDDLLPKTDHFKKDGTMIVSRSVEGMKPLLLIKACMKVEYTKMREALDWLYLFIGYLKL